MLKAVIFLRAEQTPGLIGFAKGADVRARPATDSPRGHSDVHPASTPLHLPVVALGELLLTKDLGDTFKPLGVIGVQLSLPDPGDLFPLIVKEKRLGSCVFVECKGAGICEKHEKINQIEG